MNPSNNNQQAGTAAAPKRSTRSSGGDVAQDPTPAQPPGPARRVVDKTTVPPAKARRGQAAAREAATTAPKPKKGATKTNPFKITAAYLVNNNLALKSLKKHYARDQEMQEALMAAKLDTTNAPGKYTDSTVRDMLVHFMSPLEEGAFPQ